MKQLEIEGVILDLDGTIYIGEAALPGSVETCQALRRRGKRLLFVSNKPLEDREAYAVKLTRMGIPAAKED
ncbi:MAG: HAD-IIA family hydrolase, partial [Bellilinea sp.]